MHKRFHADGPPSPQNVNISQPSDLRGKRIGVWWASTQHYALVRFLQQMGIEYETNVDYQHPDMRNKPLTLIPVHWKEDKNKVLLVKLDRDEMWHAWNTGAIHAAWVGFPHYYYFKQNGTLLSTNRVLADWRMVTFDALVISRKWFETPPDPRMMTKSMMRSFLTELAKANYYYMNNTKEFSMRHKVTKGVLDTAVPRVDGKISGVLGQPSHLTWPHISAYKYMTIKEQMTCQWMGCGNQSRMAWALRDTAMFMQTVTYGANEAKRGLEDGTILPDYSMFLDTQILYNLDQNKVDGSYVLVQGEEVEFGYHDDYAE